MHYTMSMVISIMVLIAMLVLYYVPKYSMQFYYNKLSRVSDASVFQLKGCYFVANGILLLAWVIAS